MITIDNKFEIGDILYLRTDPNQLPRMVVAFSVDHRDTMYEVACGVENSKHYSFELSVEKNAEVSVL